MPVLNYDERETDLPDVNKEQKCDGCGCVQHAQNMYFAYYGKSYGVQQVGVICHPCYSLVYGGPAPLQPHNTAKKENYG